MLKRLTYYISILIVGIVTLFLGVKNISAASFINEYPIPSLQAHPSYITTGPDGALWFTETTNNFTVSKIGRITTSGTFTEYTIPTPQADPVGITTGPDGELWFAEGDGYKIGRITTSGDITEYLDPQSQGHPQEIITGPDGALWFTGHTSDA